MTQKRIDDPTWSKVQVGDKVDRDYCGDRLTMTVRRAASGTAMVGRDYLSGLQDREKYGGPVPKLYAITREEPDYEVGVLYTATVRSAHSITVMRIKRELDVWWASSEPVDGYSLHPDSDVRDIRPLDDVTYPEKCVHGETAVVLCNRLQEPFGAYSHKPNREFIEQEVARVLQKTAPDFASKAKRVVKLIENLTPLKLA